MLERIHPQGVPTHPTRGVGGQKDQHVVISSPTYMKCVTLVFNISIRNSNPHASTAESYERTSECECVTPAFYLCILNFIKITFLSTATSLLVSPNLVMLHRNRSLTGRHSKQGARGLRTHPQAGRASPLHLSLTRSRAGRWY